MTTGRHTDEPEAPGSGSRFSTVVWIVVCVLAISVPVGVRTVLSSRSDAADQVRREFTYSVASHGSVSTDVADFARSVAEVFADPRGWRAAGFRFREVAHRGDFTVHLAAADAVPDFGSSCSPRWSCRVQDDVIINEERWLHASSAWNKAGLPLSDYRHMVVNHETGHWLGHRHTRCTGAGRPAPVMMQQSKGLDGCRANPFPLATERSTTRPEPTSPDFGPRGVSASSWVLLDAERDEVLAGQGVDTAHPVASTAKVMTAVVVLESGVDLEAPVTVTRSDLDYVTRTEASSAGLKTGDRLTIRQLLYALLLPSGSDAAHALGDAVGEGRTTAERIRDFVGRMNSRATSLGLIKTRFASVDGSGKSAADVSTPRSLARLAAHALRDRTFATIVGTGSTRQVATTRTGKPRNYLWKNSNLLLGNTPGVVGVKTGTSTPSGPCLVFAARRDGTLVVGVLLDSASRSVRFLDANRILDWLWP